VPRITDYFGRFLRHGNAYPGAWFRPVDRRRGGWSGYEIHENTRVQGRTAKLRGRLEHYAYRSLATITTACSCYASSWRKAMYERGQRCGLVRGAGEIRSGVFRARLPVRLGFLDGWRGLVFRLIEAKLRAAQVPGYTPAVGGLRSDHAATCARRAVIIEQQQLESLRAGERQDLRQRFADPAGVVVVAVDVRVRATELRQHLAQQLPEVCERCGQRTGGHPRAGNQPRPD